jgi:hypothetical protein
VRLRFPSSAVESGGGRIFHGRDAVTAREPLRRRFIHAASGQVGVCNAVHRPVAHWRAHPDHPAPRILHPSFLRKGRAPSRFNTAVAGACEFSGAMHSRRCPKISRSPVISNGTCARGSGHASVRRFRRIARGAARHHTPHRMKRMNSSCHGQRKGRSDDKPAAPFPSPSAIWLA